LNSKWLSGELSIDKDSRCVDRQGSLPGLFVELLGSRDNREGECIVLKTLELRHREMLKD